MLFTMKNKNPRKDEIKKTSVSKSSQGKEKVKINDNRVKETVKSDPIVPGDVHMATVKSVKPLFVIVTLPDGKSGKIHVSEISDTTSKGKHPGKELKPGEKLKVMCIGYHTFAKHNSLAITHPRLETVYNCSSRRSVVESKQLPPPTDVKAGDKVCVYVKSYDHPYLHVFISPSVTGKVHFLNLTKKKKIVKKASTAFEVGSCYKATVLKSSEKGELELSFLEDVDFKEGSHVLGVIHSKSLKKGLVLTLPLGYRGYSSLTDIMDEFLPPDEMFSKIEQNKVDSCIVLSADNANKRCYLSLRSSRVNPNPGLTVIDKEIVKYTDVAVGDVLRGFVQILSHGIIITLGRNVTSYLAKSELADDDKELRDGDVVKVKVTSFNAKESKIRVVILSRDYVSKQVSSAEVAVPVKRKLDSESEENRPRKQIKLTDVKPQPSVQVGVEMLDRLKNLTYKKSMQLHETGQRLTLGEHVDLQTQTAVSKQEETSESEDEDEDKISHKGKKPTEKKQEEKLLFEHEKAVLTGGHTPDSIDAFEHMLAKSPNDAKVWVSYMSFHLASAEYAKARAVAERALEVINFRQENEKLIVWVALLNLENCHGTDEALRNTFQKALQYNDQLKIYRSMAEIYEADNKLKYAEELYKVMSKKFKEDVEVWISFCRFYMKTGQSNQARSLLQRCAQILTKKESTYFATRLADMEYRYGDPDRGRNLFETLLSSFPKRTDIWLVYIDKLTKSGNIEGARWVCERAVSLRIPPRKIRILYKRYMDLERRHGSAKSVEAVQHKALGYLQEVTSAS